MPAKGYDQSPGGSMTYWPKIFKTPGQGKIIALQGRLGDTPNGECWEGLQQVLSKNPGIQLLQWESAQWDLTQAYNDTKPMLVTHPDVAGSSVALRVPVAPVPELSASVPKTLPRQPRHP